MNTSVKFIKSFSKGQITIPKEFRNQFGMEDEFWLKLYIENGKIIAEPVETEKNKNEWKKKLLTIKSEWFDEGEIYKNRQQVEDRLKTLAS